MEFQPEFSQTLVGAHSELIRLKKLLHSSQLSNHYSSSPLKDFSGASVLAGPPYYGGLWEAAVKSMKTLLLKTTGNQTLWRDELLTLLYEAALILISRSLTLWMPRIPQDVQWFPTYRF